MNKIRIGVFFAIIAGLAVVASMLHYTQPAPATPGTVASSQELAEHAGLMAVSLANAEGNLTSLSTWHGKLLIVNFWATWCGPCVEEMPILDKVRRANLANGVEIIGIAADPPNRAAAFLRQTPVSYPILADANAALELSRKLGNRFGVLPHTVVYSPEGRRIMAKVGTLTEAELASIIVQSRRN